MMFGAAREDTAYPGRACALQNCIVALGTSRSKNDLRMVRPECLCDLPAGLFDRRFGLVSVMMRGRRVGKRVV